MGRVYTEFMTLSFLKPRPVNVIVSLIIVSLPILREHAVLPTGGYEVVYYRPVFLLTSYLQMQDWYPFLLMVGFNLFIYVVVSGVVAIGLLIIKPKKKQSRRIS